MHLKSQQMIKYLISGMQSTGLDLNYMYLMSEAEATKVGKQFKVLTVPGKNE